MKFDSKTNVVHPGGIRLQDVAVAKLQGGQAGGRGNSHGIDVRKSKLQGRESLRTTETGFLYKWS